MQLLNKAQRILSSEEVADPMYTVIDMVKIEDLNSFVIRCLNVHGTEEKIIEANQVGDVVIQMLIKKKLISEGVQQSFVDVLITSALLHNLFYDPTDWTTLFLARKELLPIAQDMDIPEQVTDAIFQAIESQLGDDMPVPTSRPVPNSPTELLAWAIWFVKEFIPLPQV